MRYGIFGDIHGQWEHFKKVLGHIYTYNNINELICLGDIFEVKIAKKYVTSFIFHDIEQVIDFELETLELLKGSRIISGNQEDRLLELIPYEKIPSELYPFLLNLPSVFNLSENAQVTHGHNFKWAEYNGGEYYHPLPKEGDKPRLFYGHNHQNALFQVKETHGIKQYNRQEITYGKPFQLDAKSYYLINVGDIKSVNPSWLLYDEDKDTITFFKLK